MLRRIEQDDEVLGEVGQRVYLQLLLAEPDRARLGDAKCCADDADVDVGQLGRVRAGRRAPVSRAAQEVAEQITAASGNSDRTNPSRPPAPGAGTNFPPMLTRASSEHFGQRPRSPARTGECLEWAELGAG